MTTNLTRVLEASSLRLRYTRQELRDARDSVLEYRKAYGHPIHARPLLTAPEWQAKAGKNPTPTYVLNLAPSTTIDGLDLCAFASAGCREACIFTAGKGTINSVRRARINRTELLAGLPSEFVLLLEHEIRTAVRRHGGRALFRLNGTSDLRWELIAPWLFGIRGAEFYDYTKWPRREDVPPNYAICYSASERDTDAKLLERLDHFGHVAVVIDTPAPWNGGGSEPLPIPDTYLGRPAWDGDELDDWRDRPGFILLRVKGDGVDDDTGFVRPTVPAWEPVPLLTP